MIIKLTFQEGYPIYINSIHLVSFWRIPESEYTRIMYSIGEVTDLVVETPEEICEMLDAVLCK